MKAKDNWVDDNLKRLIFELGLDDRWKKASKASFKGDNTLLDAMKRAYSPEIIRVCKNLASASYRRVRKCRCKVGRSILSGNAYFVTLTFRDEVFANTTAETRRRAVSRVLRGVCFRYVANIDFGDKTEREHYHAIVEPYPFMTASWQNGKKWYQDMPDLREWIKLYGNLTIQKIGNTETDEKAVAQYTAQLSAHAVKDSTLKGEGTKAPRLIYSRRRW